VIPHHCGSHDHLNSHSYHHVSSRCHALNRRKRCPLLVVSTVVELHWEAIGEHFEQPSFSSLIREISKVRPSQSKSRPKRGSNLDYPAFRIFRKWVEELHKRFSPLPPNTTCTCFQLLFPEEDVHRKYNIQETRMAQLLADCFGIDNKAFENWSQEEATGCLGQELKVVLQRSCSVSKPFWAEEMLTNF